MPGREQGGRPRLPGRPAAGGPDGHVQALLAERPLDDREGRAGPAVGVGRRGEPGRPAEQPRLGLGADEEGHRPGPVGGACGQPDDPRAGFGYPPGRGPNSGGWGCGVPASGGCGCGVPAGDSARELGGEAGQPRLRPGGGGWGSDGVEGAHAGPLGGWRRSGGRAAAAERRVESRTRDRPGGRLASAGGRSRTPGPGTRAGPLRPRGEAGVAVQGALGGVPVRHGRREGAAPRARCQARPGPPAAFIGSQPSRAAVDAGSARLIRVFRLWFRHLWCLSTFAVTRLLMPRPGGRR